MNTSLKIAIGGAIAGFLVHQMMQRRATDPTNLSRGDRFANAAGPEAAYDDSTRQPTDEVVADTNAVGNERSQRGPQPQDWRVVQNLED